MLGFTHESGGHRAQATLPLALMPFSLHRFYAATSHGEDAIGGCKKQVKLRVGECDVISRVMRPRK